MAAAAAERPIHQAAKLSQARLLITAIGLVVGCQLTTPSFEPTGATYGVGRGEMEREWRQYEPLATPKAAAHAVETTPRVRVAWGFAWGATSIAEAEASALRQCNLARAEHGFRTPCRPLRSDP